MTEKIVKLTTIKIASLTYKVEDAVLKVALRKLFSKVFILEDKGCWIIHEDWSKYAYWCGEGAHRFVYRTLNQEWIEGWLICHTCDRPGCINPKHLFKGTAQDNMRDMVIKNRGRGERRFKITKREKRRYLD